MTIDRYGYPLMGRRHLWIILAQLGLCINFVLLALVPDPAANLPLLSLMGFTLSFFSSLQDVATDGLAIDVLPVAQRGRANGVMYSGALLGYSLASAGGSMLLNRYGFSTVALTGAGLVGVILLFPLLLRERPGERLLRGRCRGRRLGCSATRTSSWRGRPLRWRSSPCCCSSTSTVTSKGLRRSTRRTSQRPRRTIELLEGLPPFDHAPPQ